MGIKSEVSSLIQACNDIAGKHLCPATAGNFSIRIDNDLMLISASGKDKTHLTEDDFVICNLKAEFISGVGKPSAEAALHGMIYQLSPETGCILHTHSVPVTVLSMLPETDNSIRFHGYEMQKTISGFFSHEETLELMVFDNDQDMHRFAKRVKESWALVQDASGLMVRGHGLYSWGNVVKDAKRHMEGLEFLVECVLTRKRYTRD